MGKKILIAALATVIMIVVMRWMSIGLESRYSSLGIVSFELAKDYHEAEDIIHEVGASKLQWNIGVDFLFIVAYTLFFSFCCKALMNNYRSSGLKTVGLVFLELSVLVGVLDLVENIAMLITLGGYGSELSITITCWSAIIKFSLAAFVVFYIAVASVLMYFIFKKKN
jgi:hypothetical protein